MSEPKSREQLGQRLDEFTHRYGETHDVQLKAEIEVQVCALPTCGTHTDAVMEEHQGYWICESAFPWPPLCPSKATVGIPHLVYFRPFAIKG